MAEISNFAFFKEHDPVFFQLANSAECVFASDPNTTLIKLHQLVEALAQDLAVRAGIELDSDIRNLFHTLRVEGNKAILPYRGLGNGIPCAIDAWPEIELHDDRQSNQFRVVIKPPAKRGTLSVPSWDQVGTRSGPSRDQVINS
ncbi:hypothetical protein NS376_05445 [Pseudomonas oryzihabitans]|nr:hypothetical protein NS376_05445 [Pseudomonas psychrotolerans]